MTNYQLYRTNHLLSGQVKWDMVIKDEVDKLSVGEFHLSPISPNIPYNLNLDEKLLNNDHSENLRLYYEKNKGIFFNDGVESQFKNNWPSTYKKVSFSDNEVFNNIVKEFYIEELTQNGEKILDTDKNPLFGQLENIELIRNYKYAGYEMRFWFYIGGKYLGWTVRFDNIKYNDTYFNNKENNICIGELKWNKDVLGGAKEGVPNNVSVCKIYAIIDWSQCTSNITGQGDWARHKSTGRIKLNKNLSKFSNIKLSNIENFNSLLTYAKYTSNDGNTDVLNIKPISMQIGLYPTNNEAFIQWKYGDSNHYYYPLEQYIDGRWQRVTSILKNIEYRVNLNYRDSYPCKANGYLYLKFKDDNLNTTNYKGFDVNNKPVFTPYTIYPYIDDISNIPCISIDNSPYTSFNYEKNYVDDYQMGAKRAKYKLFNKQFQFFCPVWLEEVKNNIKFKLSLWSDTEDREIASNQLLVERNGDDKFSKYLFKYIDELKLNIGNDDLININLDSGITSLTGVDLITGTLKVLEDTSIVNNLKHRERPLLESDSIILKNYNRKNLICPQLFNFNIYFNISDIINTIPTEQFENSKLWFKLFVYADDMELEIVDFYSNYEFLEEKLHCDRIQCEKWINGFSDMNLVPREGSDYKGGNVLDYLKDNKFIGHINKNKYLQSIFHWSLVGNNDYLFNLYDNFGCINYEEHLNYVNEKYNRSTSDMKKIPHLYGRGLDITHITSYDKIHNTNSWCNIVEMELVELIGISNAWKSANHWSEWIGDWANVFYNIVKNGISFDFGDQWYNDNHYISYNKPFEFLDDTHVFPDKKLVNVFIYIPGYSDNDWKNLNNTGGRLEGKGYTTCLNQYYLYKEINNIIYKFYIANNMNEFNFNNFLINHLQKYQNDAMRGGWAKYSNDNYWSSMKLKTILEGLQKPKIVKFDKSLICNRVSSPSQKTDEISYYKLDHCDPYSKYVVRYDGKIKPTFIKKDDYRKNYTYYKKDLLEIINEMNNYTRSSFDPLYPSIGYYSIGSKEELYTRDSKVFNLKGSFEYTHYNDSLLYQLPIEININIDDNYETYVTRDEIDEIIIEEIKNTFNTNPKWIYKLYDIDIDYNVEKNNNKHIYKYNIKLTLK